MSLNRTAHRAAPLLMRGRALRSRALPSRMPAIAILIPRAALSTETSSRGTGGGAPPPGFDIEMAKRPLKKEAQKPTASTENDAVQKAAKTEEDARALKELAAQKEEQKCEESLAKKKEDKKLTLWQKVKKEAAHYWDGTKLLAVEVRISSRLALKMAAGYELTRRENRQVCIHSLKSQD
jgi:LETM1 and EF-hand domain-containing protein 1